MLFDKNIIITGKHSAYMDLLRDKGFFSRHLDIYINSAIVGFQYNRKSLSDKSETYKDKRTQIHTEQLVKESSILEFIYRLIMLLDNQKDSTLEDRINRAFRDDSLNDVSEKHSENTKVFISYVLGGVEVLYEKIIEKGATEQDLMKNAYEFMKEQNLSFINRSADDILNEL
ncbi:hypothetical protein LCY76_02310 [Fictibacillus sp. KIGAM418]|uniref:Uncharacterized protein n=1 Tax=Fictibacillus marinisediminis TaxID=2878389 RepID=A0A9X1X9X2_9BACL|nr:hypothetical protein [Fictibacillus marinisediminis]MCK6255458.1 hypothetical protein [Fictibacillus marinisediminis]